MHRTITVNGIVSDGIFVPYQSKTIYLPLPGAIFDPTVPSGYGFYYGSAYGWGL